MVELKPRLTLVVKNQVLAAFPISSTSLLQRVGVTVAYGQSRVLCVHVCLCAIVCMHLRAWHILHDIRQAGGPYYRCKTMLTEDTLNGEQGMLHIQRHTQHTICEIQRWILLGQAPQATHWLNMIMARKTWMCVSKCLGGCDQVKLPQRLTGSIWLWQRVNWMMSRLWGGSRQNYHPWKCLHKTMCGQLFDTPAHPNWNSVGHPCLISCCKAIELWEHLTAYF